MTILYSSDFNKHPSAIIDLQTKNRSWLEFASKLKAMGVKNWGFHLTLLDPSLQGVDPLDPNLDDITILKIQHEARRNWWYYPREIFRVPSNTGGLPVHLRANRANIAGYWSLFNHFVTYLQQIRQTGKSLQARSIATGFHTCWATGSTHILFTKSDLRADEIKNYKEIKETLPGYLHYPHPKDKDNQQDFTTLCHKNVTFSYIPSNDPDNANKVGRGKSPTLVMPDEVPFLTYSHISIPALIGSTTTSFDEAKAAGAFYGIFYTTTAGDLSTDEGKFVYENIKQKGMFFSEILYDAQNQTEAKEIIFSHSSCRPVPHITIAFNHLQLGYSDDWLLEKLAQNPGSKDQKKRDQLNMWTFGSQENPIHEKYLSIIRRSVNDTFQSERISRYYTLRCHKPLAYIRERTIVMGLDTSDAIGRDAITGVGVDVETLETLFCFSINETNLIHFGTFLAQFLKDFPRVTLIPEAKSSWTSGIRDQLLIELPRLGIDPGRRIFSYIVDEAKVDERSQKDYRDYTAGYPSERKYFPYRSEIGFKTGAASRDVLTRDVLMNVTKEIPHLMRDPMLVDELSTLVERKGRIDHALSGNDDHVISLCLAHWFLRYGRNLDHYGIDSTKIMRQVATQEVEDPATVRKRVRQDRIKMEIQVILDKMKNSTSTMELAYLEARLKVLKGEVTDVDDPSKLISSMTVQSHTRSSSQLERQAKTSGLFSNILRR